MHSTASKALFSVQQQRAAAWLLVCSSNEETSSRHVVDIIDHASLASGFRVDSFKLVCCRVAALSGRVAPHRSKALRLRVSC